MNYFLLHHHLALSPVRTSGGLRLLGWTQEFDYTLEVDDYCGQQILYLHSHSPSIAHSPSSVPANHPGQLSLYSRMLFAHLLVLLGFGSLPCCRVLRFVVVLDYCSSSLRSWLQAFGSQPTLSALTGSKKVLPALIWSCPRAARSCLSSGTNKFLAAVVKLKLLWHKQPWVGAWPWIVHNNSLAYAKGFGVTDRDARHPATPDTLYQIGSVTKMFTGMPDIEIGGARN